MPHQDNQLPPEQYRHQTTQHRPYHTGNEKLFGNHFMVLAKNVFGNKSFMVMMVMVLAMNTSSVHATHPCLQYYFVTHINLFIKITYCLLI